MELLKHAFTRCTIDIYQRGSVFLFMLFMLVLLMMLKQREKTVFQDKPKDMKI